MNRTILPGSTPIPLAGLRVLGPVPQDQRCALTLRLRRKAQLQALLATHAYVADCDPAQRQYLTRTQYQDQFGAELADLVKVADFARSFGLEVLETSSARRSVFLSGTAQQCSAAFGTDLEQVAHPAGVFRRPTLPVTLPAELADIVEGVFGLQTTPLARPHLRPARPHAASAGFSVPELAHLYQFPAGLDGSGQCIAIIELGGGYRRADLAYYFHQLKLALPSVTSVTVGHAKNQPGAADSADGEVMLDIEVAAAIAPKARIVVYFAPNTEQGFLDAITLALHDRVHRPNVISISWGNPEKNWSEQALRSFDQTFQSAAALGVTICCAAGDAGSGDEDPDRSAADGLAHADFPGSSPHVLCCGGTRLTAASGVILSETVWNNDARRSATGGGVSAFFAAPDYQHATPLPPTLKAGGPRGRGVPDVAGNADPATGYRVRVDGQDLVFGGTSAVAPLWAALIALMNQQLGHPLGFLNPLLYGSLAGSPALRDITVGNNGAYQAKAGWDPCTGWGTPNGKALLQALLRPR